MNIYLHNTGTTCETCSSTLLGYANFPYNTPATTDGFVELWSRWGANDGSCPSNNLGHDVSDDLGTTATHEIGAAPGQPNETNGTSSTAHATRAGLRELPARRQRTTSPSTDTPPSGSPPSTGHYLGLKHTFTPNDGINSPFEDSGETDVGQCPPQRRPYCSFTGDLICDTNSEKDVHEQVWLRRQWAFTAV